ncbi:MAG: KGG domain-containing protein [Patescibacteria group bacterium]
MANRNEGDMTVREAGRKGGQRTSQTHGREFYEEIGHMGGAKGGRATSQKYGPEFYSEIGHKGGQKVRDLINKGKMNEGR